MIPLKAFHQPGDRVVLTENLVMGSLIIMAEGMEGTVVKSRDGAKWRDTMVSASYDVKFPGVLTPLTVEHPQVKWVRDD